MAICRKCGTGFDIEVRENCPACGTYWSSYRRRGASVGNGLAWSLSVPFLIGLGLSLILRTADAFALGLLASVFCFYLWSIFWAYADANARSKSGCLVAVLVALLSWPLGLILWIVFRP